MESREIVRRAIEFDNPPRVPFFIGNFWQDKLTEKISGFPNDVCDCWEMDRQKKGWFFNNPTEDDWGCGWEKTDVSNMGQVTFHPLADWSKLGTFSPPNPRDPFYFERIADTIDNADDRYVVVTSHFNLIERLHMLHGFERTLEDFYLEPEKMHRLLDIILDFKIEHFDELAKRFGNRIHGLFLTDDWGTQKNTLISPDIFKEFFLDRYKKLTESVHGHGWHFILHSCGRVNNFVPFLIEAGMDVLNLQQPQAYGIKEFGEQFAGKICFLTTVDIQSTLPTRNAQLVRAEAEELVKYWSKPSGGFIVFNYGDSEAIGTTDEITEVMFQAFYELANYWTS